MNTIYATERKTSPGKLLMGIKLVTAGAITQDQLNDAIAYQQFRISLSGCHHYLGAIMVGLGYITRDKMESIVNDD